MSYTLLLFISQIFILPLWIFRKKTRPFWKQKLGLQLPKGKPSPHAFWFHMVSIGETRAMIPVYKEFKRRYPKAAFYLSSTTGTGHIEAKTSLPDADCYFFLPTDFPLTMKKLARRLKPNILILSEGDFWLNMCKEVQRQGGKVVLLNGKISKKSVSRYLRVPKFSQRLFSQVDHFFVQNERYAKRFASCGVAKEKLLPIGNLKMAISPILLNTDEKNIWLKRFKLDPKDTIITLGSTHEGEEELLLPFLKGNKVLILPRHPERFNKVKRLLDQIGNPDFILVSQMGILPLCYQLSSVAVVGGSFFPKIGGHNIFEPIQVKTPVIFGPYMEAQPDLVNMVLEHKAGIQTSVEGFGKALKKAKGLRKRVEELSGHGGAILEKTLNQIEPLLKSY